MMLRAISNMSTGLVRGTTSLAVATLTLSCSAGGPSLETEQSALALTPSAWCRGALPGPTPPALGGSFPRIYADPAAVKEAFAPLTFGDSDGRGQRWTADDPATTSNEELETLCRGPGVPKSEPWQGVCDGHALALDPTLDVPTGCLRLRYVRSANCSAAGLVDEDANATTPPTVPSDARAYRRGYVVGDSNGSPTNFLAIQHPKNALGEEVAVLDSTVRVRFNPSGLQAAATPDDGFSVYARYVSEDDHYVATLRRSPNATDCISEHVTCDASGNILAVEGQLVIAEKLCGGPLVVLASVSAPIIEKAWYAFELTALGSQLYASVTTTSLGAFPIFKQLRVDLSDASLLERRRLALGLPSLTTEEYPAALPAGTSGISVKNLAAYIDDWSSKPTGTTVCHDDQALATLVVDDDVDFYGAGPAGLLCPGWGYSAVAGDCNDFRRAYRPGAPEPCGFSDFNCDGVVQPVADCPVPIEPVQRTGSAVGTALDDAMTAERRWVGRVNGSVVANSVQYSIDATSPRPDHQVVSMTTPGDGRRIELERANISPPWSLCDETSPYLVADDPSLPGFDGVANLKYAPKLAVKVKNQANAKDLAVYLGDSAFTNYYRLRFRSGQGEVYVTESDWVSFSLSLENLGTDPVGKPDPCKISRVRVRGVDDGSAQVTITLDALTKVPRSLDFPNGVVSVTFDDGFLRTYTEAAPCLDGSDPLCQVLGGSNAPLPATLYPIISALGTYLPEENDYFMSEAQLVDLHGRGWDIGVHAFDQHIHGESYPRVPEVEGRSDMRAAKQWLFEKLGAGSGYDNFAYPKGEFAISSPGEITQAVDLARTEFTSARTINWQLRELPQPSDMHKLRVLYVTRSMTVADVRKAVEIAERHAEWVILVFHDFAHSPEEQLVKNYFVLTDDFRAMVRMLREPGRTVQLKSVSQVMATLPVVP
jgi:peptidoglycan/xylan/chitin deacetylase (PgdA/CDA1 family)